MRNFHGAEVNFGYPETQLHLADFQKIFDADFLSQIQHIKFNGNLGDFGLARDAISIVDYVLSASSARITIETNGSMRTRDWWAHLANDRVHVLFALDGLQDVHHLYRQDTNWTKVIENAKSLIEHGGNAYWKMIPFEHNRHQIPDCEKMARQLGFRQFLLWDQGRNRGPVFTRDGLFSHWLGEPEGQTEILQNRLDSHYRSIQKALTFYPRQPTSIDCQHLKIKEIYVAADGSIYPCCFLGFFPSTMDLPDNANINGLMAQNNALVHGLEKSLQWFENVYRSWHVDQGQRPLQTCVRVCGQSASKL